MKPPCVILAGGRSNRMGGGDKCLMPLASKPILAHVLERISSQTDRILINSNSLPSLFTSFGWPVLPDMLKGFQGPLVGILTGMIWARQVQPVSTHILSVSCDTPFLPYELVQRLAEGPGAEIAIARDHDQIHPLIGLWPLTLATSLAADIETSDVRSVRQWLLTQQYREIMFGAEHFCNLNTRDELEKAARLVQTTRH